MRRVEYKADMEHGFQVGDISTVVLYLMTTGLDSIAGADSRQ